MVDKSLRWYNTEVTIGLPYDVDVSLTAYEVMDALAKLDVSGKPVYTVEATETRFEKGFEGEQNIAVYRIKPNTVYLCTLNNKVINVLLYTK